MGILQGLAAATWTAASLLQFAEARFTYPDCVNGPMSRNLICSQGADPAKRAAALVANMTLEDKLQNLVDRANGSQALGLSRYDWWNEALHGVAYSPGVSFGFTGQFTSATSFPLPITIAAAFDDALVESIGLTIGAEARAFANNGRGGLDVWTPNINPFKDPRWGRGLETPGEDPFRIEGYVKHLLRGMEWASQEPEQVGGRQMIATCKHYAAYDLERWNGANRHWFNAIVSMQDLVEYYMPPFRQCARDSNVGSIMCSYNAVNGTPACADSYLMQTVLREHWNWTQHGNYIVSDCNAVRNIWNDHKWVANAAQAAGKTYAAGDDNVCEATVGSTDVRGAYQQGLLSIETIDTALKRQYEGLVRAGYWTKEEDDEAGFRSLGAADVNTQDAQNLARQAAVDGMVLLKNDGTLPHAVQRNQPVAVVGMWANDRMRMLGNYAGRPPVYHTPAYAAQQLGLQINYADGPVYRATNYSAAIAAAKASDIIYYFGGIDTSVETEDLDRTVITWPDVQLSLLRELSALGKPLVVVQMGTSIDNTPLLSNPNISSIIWAGYPGMFGGPAAFDIITGAKAPAGRLPITQYPANYTAQVPMTDMSLRPSAANPGRTYKWYSSAVQDFGFGLHYTNFTVALGALNTTTPGRETQDEDERPKADTAVFWITELLDPCTQRHKDRCAFPSIPLSITNTGTKTSDFVALAFITPQAGPAPFPRKELASYTRERDIEPGEVRQTALQFSVGSFARVDASGNTVLYAGSYCVGVDVPERERVCFEVLGEDRVLDAWPQPKAGNGTTVR
ncbi:glycosyl hydrolase family 3 N terminal domain-containing protein [Polyplosphaeria fusca]|uniref:xylan 1,4-beta-xylosidase n=1 Tax=Polyplosphaeria fusca TaxID=682080 RepID=A0A9P4QQY9_9PLEO|nr:glycosyl hydrolase family 3 N terminal domain-containing protein [Polyplosphaeria fusca]